jgi:hypothetical protein
MQGRLIDGEGAAAELAPAADHGRAGCADGHVSPRGCCVAILWCPSRCVAKLMRSVTSDTRKAQWCPYTHEGREEAARAWRHPSEPLASPDSLPGDPLDDDDVSATERLVIPGLREVPGLPSRVPRPSSSHRIRSRRRSRGTEGSCGLDVAIGSSWRPGPRILRHAARAPERGRDEPLLIVT